MIRPLAYAILTLGAACTTPPLEQRPDATPFVCASPIVVVRYRIDTAHVPATAAEVTADGFDVVGDDGVTDNQLGDVFRGAIDVFKPDFAPQAATNLALAAAVDWEIETDACTETGEVRVHVGTPAQIWPRAGGALAGGSTLTAAHGCGSLPLGTLTGGTDPGWVAADQVAIDLVIGDDGLTGTIGFALDAPAANDAVADAFAAFLTQIEPHPTWTPTIKGSFDANSDDVVTPAELQASALYVSLLSPDEPVPRPRPAGDPVCATGTTSFLSFGLAIHARALTP